MPNKCRYKTILHSKGMLILLSQLKLSILEDFFKAKLVHEMTFSESQRVREEMGNQRRRDDNDGQYNQKGLVVSRIK